MPQAPNTAEYHRRCQKGAEGLRARTASMISITSTTACTTRITLQRHIHDVHHIHSSMHHTQNIAVPHL